MDKCLKKPVYNKVIREETVTLLRRNGDAFYEKVRRNGDAFAKKR